jgi:hypothetical protein
LHYLRHHAGYTAQMNHVLKVWRNSSVSVWCLVIIGAFVKWENSDLRLIKSDFNNGGIVILVTRTYATFNTFIPVWVYARHKKFSKVQQLLISVLALL